MVVTKYDFKSILLSIRDMGLLYQRAHLLEGDMESAQGKKHTGGESMIHDHASIFESGPAS